MDFISEYDELSNSIELCLYHRYHSSKNRLVAVHHYLTEIRIDIPHNKDGWVVDDYDEPLFHWQKIRDFPLLITLSVEIYPFEDLTKMGGNRSLKYLTIGCQENPSELRSIEGMDLFPHLETLEIYHCPYLNNVLEVLSTHKKIFFKKLVIKNCRNYLDYVSIDNLLEYCLKNEIIFVY